MWWVSGTTETCKGIHHPQPTRPLAYLRLTEASITQTHKYSNRDTHAWAVNRNDKSVYTYITEKKIAWTIYINCQPFSYTQHQKTLQICQYANVVTLCTAAVPARRDNSFLTACLWIDSNTYCSGSDSSMQAFCVGVDKATAAAHCVHGVTTDGWVSTKIPL